MRCEEATSQAEKWPQQRPKSVRQSVEKVCSQVILWPESRVLGQDRRPPQGVFAAPLWASATICLLPVCSACLLPTHLLLSQLKVQQRSSITSALVIRCALTNPKLIGEPCNGPDICHWIPLLTQQSTEYPRGHLGLMWDEDLCFRSAAFWAFSVGVRLLGRFPAALRLLLNTNLE